MSPCGSAPVHHLAPGLQQVEPRASRPAETVSRGFWMDAVRCSLGRAVVARQHPATDTETRTPPLDKGGHSDHIRVLKRDHRSTS